MLFVQVAAELEVLALAKRGEEEETQVEEGRKERGEKGGGGEACH